MDTPETPLDLLAAIKRVVERYPDNVNPRDATGKCVYQNTVNQRCLFGALLIEEYGQVYKEEWEQYNIDTLFYDLFPGTSFDVANLASEAQEIADGNMVRGATGTAISPDTNGKQDRDRTWSQTYALLERKLNGE